jgi:DNA processing protein
VENFYQDAFPFVTFMDNNETEDTNMKQGILFQNHTRRAGCASLTNDERLHAVAVSVISSPCLNDVWNMISFSTPSEILTRLSARRSLTTQEFLVEAYSASPLKAAEKIIERAASKSIRVLTYWDEQYPPLLREIQHPPIVLYARGHTDAVSAVAVVGTRKSDPRSAATARRIAADLASAGITVVSGMAVGIDREAHQGALDAGGGTVGVLANGIDVVYPAANRDLYRRIESALGSGFVSEYPPGIRGGKWAFSRRNRIISGMCAGTVVVKAGASSGALITARHAADQNREVFACPGFSFDAGYAGCHELIRSGAVLVSRTEDILSELSASCGFTGVSRTHNGPLDEEYAHVPGETEGDRNPDDSLEGRILKLVSGRHYDIDSIIRMVSAPPAEVNEAVISLELCGRIMRNGNTIAGR